MKLRELVALNHDCSEMFIRETDGNFSKPVFHKHLTSGEIPEEILEREVKHFQAGLSRFSGNDKIKGCLNINLYM